MIVIVVAKLAREGTDAYHGTVRDGTGEGSSLIPDTSVVTGSSPAQIEQFVRERWAPPLIEKLVYGGLRVEVREDPAWLGM